MSANKVKGKGKIRPRTSHENPEGEQRYSSTLSLTSVPRPFCFTPGKEIRDLLYRRLGWPQNRSGRVRKISPPLGFDSRTVNPVAIRYTDWAIPAHTWVVIWVSTNTTVRKLKPRNYVQIFFCLHFPGICHFVREIKLDERPRTWLLIKIGRGGYCLLKITLTGTRAHLVSYLRRVRKANLL
jgi:hypothetical protein